MMVKFQLIHIDIINYYQPIIKSTTYSKVYFYPRAFQFICIHINNTKQQDCFHQHAVFDNINYVHLLLILLKLFKLHLLII